METLTKAQVAREMRTFHSQESTWMESAASLCTTVITLAQANSEKMVGKPAVEVLEHVGKAMEKIRERSGAHLTPSMVSFTAADGVTVHALRVAVGEENTVDEETARLMEEMGLEARGEAPVTFYFPAQEGATMESLMDFSKVSLAHGFMNDFDRYNLERYRLPGGVTWVLSPAQVATMMGV